MKSPQALIYLNCWAEFIRAGDANLVALDFQMYK